MHNPIIIPLVGDSRVSLSCEHILWTRLHCISEYWVLKNTVFAGELPRVTAEGVCGRGSGRGEDRGQGRAWGVRDGITASIKEVHGAAINGIMQ